MTILSRCIAFAILCAAGAAFVNASFVPTVFPLANIETIYGTITIRLRPEAAPLTVANFAKLATTGFFRNTSFYRYEPGFVLQGGGDGAFNDSGASTSTVPLEYDLPNVNMSVGLARGNDPNSGSSEFFINLADNSAHLAPNTTSGSLGYCVFGEVVGGFEVIAAILQQPIHVFENTSFHLFNRPEPRIIDISIVNVSAACSDSVLSLPIPTPALPWVRLDTVYGPIDWQLRPDAAPLTVANFKRLIDSGFYANSSIYRYEPGFVMQGGQNEFFNHEDMSHYVPLEYCLPNVNLTIGVSRFESPSSGSSEYFINIGNNAARLAPGGVTLFGYAVFAQVIGGVSTLNTLAGLPTTQFENTPYHLYRLPYPEVTQIRWCTEPVGSANCVVGPSSPDHYATRVLMLIVVAGSVGGIMLVVAVISAVRRAKRRKALEALPISDVHDVEVDNGSVTGLYRV